MHFAEIYVSAYKTGLTEISFAIWVASLSEKLFPEKKKISSFIWIDFEKKKKMKWPRNDKRVLGIEWFSVLRPDFNLHPCVYNGMCMIVTVLKLKCSVYNALIRMNSTYFLT